MTRPGSTRLGRARRRVPGWLLVTCLVLALCGAGVGLYLNERNSRQQVVVVGNPTAEDWIELDVTAQGVDTSALEVSLSVDAIPHGSLAEGPDSYVFTREVEITSVGLTASTFRTTAGDVAPLQVVTAGLNSGTPTDYPFDHYSISAGWAATDHGKTVPLSITYSDSDPFFVVRPTKSATGGSVARLEARAGRSRATFILAWFMMAAMWALALAVLGGAEVLARKRQGFVWPALGWMAATLFALVGLRNAAPGSPPIGSLMDYVAFFWAEGIIAASLAVTVALAVRNERRDRAEASTT
ncbi:DUF4436 family protein [Streptacidiphilus jiangxiensis]|uniref:DUF4436 domain-containing protein n=1 Tax=Streptacidiphilus jiangxiensis TaxID=235985 RepID=A0A1H7WTG5_STRJI|nr:DUF4436 family protein [Streptacidiphilus jiangxiensis]SEM24856.1 protein of unknown function [Streptacidiphilus jiangxiensis]